MNKSHTRKQAVVRESKPSANGKAPRNWFWVEVGKRIEQAIKEAAFPSKEAAAKAAGVGRVSVYRWCAGDQAPRPQQFMKLAQVLSRPVAWFYDVSDEMVARAEIEERIRQMAAGRASEALIALLVDVMRGADLAEGWRRHSGAPEVFSERELAIHSGATEMVRAGIRQRFPDFDRWPPARQRRELQALLDELTS